MGACSPCNILFHVFSICTVRSEHPTPDRGRGSPSEQSALPGFRPPRSARRSRHGQSACQPRHACPVHRRCRPLTCASCCFSRRLPTYHATAAVHPGDTHCHPRGCQAGEKLARLTENLACNLLLVSAVQTASVYGCLLLCPCRWMCLSLWMEPTCPTTTPVCWEQTTGAAAFARAWH